MTTRPRLAGLDSDPTLNLDVPDPLFNQLRDALKPVYQLLRRLGEGGMGAVYLAREPSLKRDVAVKVMLPWLAKDATARARFEREAQSVAAITHPNVINVYGTGELPDGTPYFIMQYVGGRSLADRLSADGPLALREARRVLAEVAAGLAAAHQRGIIHRDIKASNILQDAESGRVIVTDFGIAAVRGGAASDRKSSGARLTQPDVGSPGTVDYMAPEQLLGEETTEASDVYSFGLLAYELLSGSGPFGATSPHEMAAAHLRDEPKPLSAHRDDIDAEMEHLVASCLAKQPADRPSSASLVQRLPPGDVLALEWPPPGLESLAGRLPRMTRGTGLGSTLLAAALLGIILADPDVGPVLPFWLLLALAGAGAVLLLAGIMATFRVLRASRRALRRGYGWLPLMEVVADRRGDTGSLITGLREYAALPRAARNRLRAWRLVGAACALAAALAPLLMLALMIRFASNGDWAPGGAAALVVLPSLLLLAAAIGLRAAENRMARGRATRRAARRKAPGIARPVVDAWNESFQRARTGQPLGDRAPHPVVTRAVIAVLLLLVLVATVAMTPLLLLPALGNYVAASGMPTFANTRNRIRRAEAGRAWAVPRDSSIGPQAAGQAFHAILLAGRTGYEAEYRPPDQPIAASFSTVTAQNPWGYLGGSRMQDSLFGLARRRAFTPAQRAFLEQVAAHPGWPQFRIAARAARIDIIAARFRLEALASANWFALPVPRFADIRAAADAAVAVAALRIAQGRPAEAETVLREMVAFGLNLSDNGLNLLESLVGSTITVTALDRLESLYDITGQRDEARRLRQVRDQVRSEQEQFQAVEEVAAGRRRNAMAYLRRQLVGAIQDSTLPKSFRWEFARFAWDMPCFNARELVFGPSPDLQSAMAKFRTEALVTPGDSVFFLVVTGQNRTPRPPMKQIAGAFAAVLGNQRLNYCVAMTAGAL